MYRYPAAEAEPPSGICIALPRMSYDEKTHEWSIFQLGIICQNNVTGKACFWDNIGPDGMITGPIDTPMRIADLETGDTLFVNCTSCHRGDNAFVVPAVGGSGTPESPFAPLFGMRFDTASATPYTPMSTKPTWQNPMLLPKDPSSPGCTSCHGFGAPSPGYCRIIERAMPVMPPDFAVGLDPLQLAVDNLRLWVECHRTTPAG